MYERTLPIQLVNEKTFIPPSVNTSSGLMSKEYEYWYSLLTMQVEMQRQCLNLQAQKLADAISQGLAQVTITYPNFLVLPISSNENQEVKSLSLSEVGQNITLKQRRGLFTCQTLLQAAQKQLANLEAASNSALAAFGGLLRFAVAHSLIHDCLPIGKEVFYAALPGEDIPGIPQYINTGSSNTELSNKTHANRFYLPQWVAFGENGQLLVNSIAEAESCVISMLHYKDALYGAVTLAPYMVVDQVYQKKYYGILGQLVNQCRSFCTYRTQEIIATIQRRSANNSLNRGVWITLPYFDDQFLLLRKIEFEIIPRGRITFLPAFLNLAIQQQITMARHNTSLNYSTRKHLLVQLAMIQKAFDTETN